MEGKKGSVAPKWTTSRRFVPFLGSSQGPQRPILAGVADSTSVDVQLVSRAPDQRMKRSLRAGLVALALLLSVGGATAGTWASFSASTENDGAFATGTLMLSNTVGAGTACFSTAAGVDINTNDRTCDALLAATVRKPGDSATADVAVKNEGSIDGNLLAYVASCTGSDAEAFHGTGDPCGVVQVTVQEYTDATRTTASNCRFGAVTGAGITCAFGPTLVGLVDAHGDFTEGLAVGSLVTGQTRWFRVGLTLPSSAGNTMQGRAATFGIVWRMAQ